MKIISGIIPLTAVPQVPAKRGILRDEEGSINKVHTVKDLMIALSKLKAELPLLCLENSKQLSIVDVIKDFSEDNQTYAIMVLEQFGE